MCMYVYLCEESRGHPWVFVTPRAPPTLILGEKLSQWYLRLPSEARLSDWGAQGSILPPHL